jgi:hypothetical protein
MGSSNTYEDKPRMCFNGHNTNFFGWYNDKQYKFNPATDGDAVFKLSTFVDFPTASSTEPVNVVIAGSYYLQYNMASGMNVETKEKQNQVTIVQSSSTGTSLLAGLDVANEWTVSNFQGTGRTLVVRACARTTGSNGAQAMLISIAMDKNLCDSSRSDVMPVPKSSPSSGSSPVYSGGSVTSGACFSGENFVEVADKGMVRMTDLRIGDFVKTGSGEFSQVYSFSHLDHEMETEYLQIFSEGLDIPLEISADHMVFVSGKVVRASQVKVGDLFGSRPVLQIQSVQRRGAYAPVTFTGDLVVSGIVASSYVAIVDGVNARILNTASHASTAFHRLVCKFDFDRCQNETYTDGISDWIAGAVNLVHRMNQHNVFVQIAAWWMALPWMVLVYCLEQMILSFSTTRAILSCFLLGLSIYGRVSKKKRHSSKLL